MATAAPRPAQTAPAKRSRAESRLRPGSRLSALAGLDFRTKEGRLLRKMKEELTAHLGGRPTAVQAALVDRAALLTLHCAMLDAKALGPGGRVGMSGHDQRAYLAFSNSLARALKELGLGAAEAERPASLADILAGASPAAKTAPAAPPGSPRAAPGAPPAATAAGKPPKAAAGRPPGAPRDALQRFAKAAPGPDADPEVLRRFVSPKGGRAA